jgi:hypothetical protein
MGVCGLSGLLVQCSENFLGPNSPGRAVMNIRQIAAFEELSNEMA